MILISWQLCQFIIWSLKWALTLGQSTSCVSLTHHKTPEQFPESDNFTGFKLVLQNMMLATLGKFLPQTKGKSLNFCSKIYNQWNILTGALCDSQHWM